MGERRVFARQFPLLANDEAAGVGQQYRFWRTAMLD
jgi:hypothetical protein